MVKLLLSTLLLSTAALSSEPAQSLNIDIDRVTVSGVSAGGQMAHQLHISYSDLFSGAGILASGPFGCAEGSLTTAMARCMGKTDGPMPVTQLIDEIKEAEEQSLVADTKNLADDPVWIFHGTLDTTVAAEVNDATAALYAGFIPAEQIVYVNDFAAIHNFPARGHGSACTEMQPPFVGDCNYDAAGEILQHLYSGLETPVAEPETILQTVSLPGAAEAGLSETAYLFVPPACTEGQQACALHLVLHGCAQSAVQVGTGFMQQSGYFAWAESNDIVLAFPQVVPGTLNPYACWDWWGYTGEDYRWRNGKQMVVVTDWIKSL
ncbi:MAG: prolyl oligopeptidase family serine peptidase [Xanthomonadales bacterium]|nr:prolyl oligopeptidase family serine peptidase [Xanthomonadales bacterium]